MLARSTHRATLNSIDVGGTTNVYNECIESTSARDSEERATRGCEMEMRKQTKTDDRDNRGWEEGKTVCAHQVDKLNGGM